MLSKKSKGLFVEVNRFSILTATTSSLSPPFTLESLNEFSLDDLEPLKDFVESLLTSKGARYVSAHCSCYPVSRFIRRHTLESMGKAKDPNYFKDLLQSQFKIDGNKSAYSVLNAQTGRFFDVDGTVQSQKELLICGADNQEFRKVQDMLVELGIFPETLQLGTVSTLAGTKDYLNYKSHDYPVLAFEVCPENSNLFILNSQQIDLCRPIPFGVKSMFPLVQQELGLKDEESAKKLFYSDTFDFTEMGTVLLRKVLKEVQASTGFYEVQTGLTINKLMVHVLPKNLRWIPKVVSEEVGIEALHIDMIGWLESKGVTFGDQIHVDGLEGRWFGLFSLLAKLEGGVDGGKKEK